MRRESTWEGEIKIAEEEDGEEGELGKGELSGQRLKTQVESWFSYIL